MILYAMRFIFLMLWSPSHWQSVASYAAATVDHDTWSDKAQLLCKNIKIFLKAFYNSHTQKVLPL